MQEYKLLNSQFITSAQNISQCPPPLLSEIAFLGRSNVGKSTIINLLCNNKNLAKSSQTPGKTQLINFFLTQWCKEEEKLQLYFVDLPGFGYAKVSKTQKELWNKNLVEFLQKRDSIRLFIHLVDSRHPNLENDVNLVSFVNGFLRGDQKILRIFTKIDKLNSSQKQKLKNSFPQALFSGNKENIAPIRQRIVQEALGIYKEN
ncbi:YihA family ribosome biogenesis GTP-binding protein [Helicobacter valdiviensis]|uniref:Probable GTP-binding protein EngB n=1 Tax=Helicobacter valdiviensis TaxID=1458358 RepID=A0A2W6MZV9_9HELI|nr:ribosome biogenesis GTP-binding protein YihA/YsxC [Helicobacter valdiviensis]PZT48938.1 YihA family ribosome biogenesis GTP-binding protein [Helicobacter valdiviensis]